MAGRKSRVDTTLIAHMDFVSDYCLFFRPIYISLKIIYISPIVAYISYFPLPCVEGI
jgi:hypothetical protein